MELPHHRRRGSRVAWWPEGAGWHERPPPDATLELALEFTRTSWLQKWKVPSGKILLRLSRCAPCLLTAVPIAFAFVRGKDVSL